MSGLRVVAVDYLDPRQAADLVELLDAYAQDPAGGGHPLSDFARANLPAQLAMRPAVFSVMAYDGEKPVGLINCIEGFSTFACRPLVNVHDVMVAAAYRGQGVGRLMLDRVIELAHQRGACKLTLEVLSGNRGAIALYEKLGFAPYQLDPVMGQAQFFQLWL